MFKQVDLSIVKRVPLRSRLNAELHLDVLNAFNNVNFIHPSRRDDDHQQSRGRQQSDGYDVTTLLTGNQARILQLVGRIGW